MRVTLDGGREVLVGGLRWRAFKEIKAKVVNAISRDVGNLMAGGLLFEADEAGNRKLNVSGLVAVLDKAVEIAEECNELFIAGCLDPAVFEDVRDTLTVGDVSRLYAAAIKLNPVSAMIEHEKNSPVGALIAESGVFRNSVPDLSSLTEAVESLTDGGSVTRPTLYDPASDEAS